MQEFKDRLKADAKKYVPVNAVVNGLFTCSLPICIDGVMDDNAITYAPKYDIDDIDFSSDSDDNIIISMVMLVGR